MGDTGELKKIASAYSKEKTFIFVEEIINGKRNIYNGYILKVKEDMIIFYDSKIRKEFPILLDTIQILKPSIKEEDGAGFN